MKKTILVTGGAGFIGSHTVDLLIQKGYAVIVVDNLSTGLRKNLNKKAKFVKCNIQDVKKHKAKLKKVKAIIHCAAQISVAISLNQPAKDASTNILGSLQLLELSKELGVKKFVFSSSAAVYGDTPQRALPLKENFPCNPLSPYGIGKRTVEDYLRFYRNVYGMQTASLRYSNVYGPRQNKLGEAGVITVFVNQLLQEKSPLIFGDGKQTRDFVYVEDVARANIAAMEQNVEGEFNISTATQITVQDLVKKIQKIMRTTTKVNHGPKRKGEVKNSSLSWKKAGALLKWKPSISQEKGLRKTVEWFINV